MIGKRLNGRYKLLKLVGGGGMANVYLAHDMILDRDVAVKILRLDFSNDDEFVKRFKREAYSITTLSHHNIVNIYDVGEEDGIYYIVMEYIDGLTLKQYIQSGPVPMSKVVSIMEQLTSAISHAHHFEIIHRDIKPQNILMAADGTVKITDFGVALATTATAITQTNSVLGSVHYLSPEQARGGVANKKSDIYSLGIVMFELLTGRPPFSGESAVSIALKHLQAETPPPRRWNKEIPQSVENIVLKATAKDPFLRYETADEMKIDLITALNPERLNEPPFYIEDDLDATRAIPVIKEMPMKDEAIDETIVVSRKIPVVSHREKKKEYKKPEGPKKKKSSPLKIAGIALLILMMSGFVAFGILPHFLFPKDVKVPKISGLSYQEATEVLKQKGLKVGTVTEEYSDEFEEDEVIRSFPKEGDVVKEKSEINLYKSIGTEKDETDNYIGRQFDAIESLLNKFYQKVETRYIESEKPKGEVVKQSPEEGTTYELGKSTIELWISAGESTVLLPSFVGWKKDSLESYGKDKGLKFDYKEEYSDVFEQGLVLTQSPDAGDNVKKGTTITVTLSKGKKEIPPQSKEIQVLVSYEPTTPNMPQKIEIFIEDATRKMDKPVQSVDITENKTFTLNISIPYKGTAKYKIVRDGMVLVEKSLSYEE